MGKVRNIFAVAASRYKNNSLDRKIAFKEAKTVWHYAAQRLLVV